MVTFSQLTDDGLDGAAQIGQPILYRTLHHALKSLQAHNDVHIANLDTALTIIAKMGILYNKLDRSSQKSYCMKWSIRS